MEKYTDIAIIGGGASGLAAAVSAKKNKDVRVEILEKYPRTGKKLLATGNGRCNLFNENASHEKFFGAKAFAKHALDAFDKDAFFASVGLFLVLSQKLLRKYLKRRPIESTNAESLVGKTAIVTETVNNEAQTGAVRVGGLVWTARAASDDTTLEKGALVVVREINGVKLICEPK